MSEHKYKLKVNSIPNIGQVIRDVLENAPDPNAPIIVEMPDIGDNPEEAKEIAFQVAYEGVITEILGAVVAGLDIELEEVND